MAQSTVTFANKVENSGATAAGKLSAADANELKSTINANATDTQAQIDARAAEISNLATQVTGLASDVSANTPVGSTDGGMIFNDEGAPAVSPHVTWTDADGLDVDGDVTADSFIGSAHQMTNNCASDVTGEPAGCDQVLNVVSLTQAEYDAGTPIATTYYLITDA